MNYSNAYRIVLILIAILIVFYFVFDLYLNFFGEKKARWDNVIINETIERPRFDKDDWSYPWYMVKHDGGFENTLGEPITAKDTTKIYHRSFCYTHLKEDKESRLKFTEATQKGDTTIIKLFDESASNFENLTLEIIGFKTFKSTYKINYVFPHESIHFKIRKQTLSLNKDTYQEGDIIIGKVNIDLTEVIHIGKNKRNVIHQKSIRGVFEAELMP